MRETVVEKYLTKRVEALAGRAYKFVSPGRRNVPDRICVFPGGVTWFVELKAPGQKTRAGQIRELGFLGHLGHLTAVLSTREEVDRWIDALAL